jgi:hypothetical protein
MEPISILCAARKSNYFKIDGLDIWTAERDINNYTGKNKVIAHPPCQQWSRLKSFAKYNPDEKKLALLCWEIVNENGGIFEHPSGSNLFKFEGANPKKIFSVNQHWWNFPAQKKTLLYFHNCEPGQYPLNFNMIEKKVHQINHEMRSRQTLEFCEYLVKSVKAI